MKTGDLIFRHYSVRCYQGIGWPLPRCPSFPVNRYCDLKPWTPIVILDPHASIDMDGVLSVYALPIGKCLVKRSELTQRWDSKRAT